MEKENGLNRAGRKSKGGRWQGIIIVRKIQSSIF